MEKSPVMLFCIAATLLAALAASAASDVGSSVKAGTPEGARVISRLERARRIDQLDAQGYRGGENREIGIFYYRKSQEIDSILTKLRQGEAVSTEEVQRAFDNSGAARLGGSY
jgi:hypothetical protein